MTYAFARELISISRSCFNSCVNCFADSFSNLSGLFNSVSNTRFNSNHDNAPFQRAFSHIVSGSTPWQIEHKRALCTVISENPIDRQLANGHSAPISSAYLCGLNTGVNYRGKNEQ